MKSNAGFSLLEVMVAVLILGVAIVGLTQGIATALSSSKESETQSTAALLAAGQIEALRAEGFITDGEAEGEGSGAFSRYRWKETVTSTSIDGLHDVSVTIQNSKTGQDIYELRTLLFDIPSDLTSTTDNRSAPQSSSRRRGGTR